MYRGDTTADTWLETCIEQATLEQTDSIQTHRVYHFKSMEGKNHELFVVEFEMAGETPKRHSTSSANGLLRSI